MLGAADGLGKTTRACAGHLMLGGRGRIPEAEVDELEVGDSLVETLKYASGLRLDELDSRCCSRR